MNFIGFLLLAIILWFAYNFIVKVVLPVYKTTNHLKKQFKNMAQQHQEQHQQNEAPVETAKQKEGEYIDFEEIK